MSDYLRVVKMSGDIQDQLFQYTLLRYVEMVTGDQCIIDDSDFWEEGKCDFQLANCFTMALTCLSSSFTNEVWTEILRRKKIGISVVEQLREIGLTVVVVGEKGWNKNDVELDFSEFNPDVIQKTLAFDGNVYYQGIWKNNLFVASLLPSIRKEFRFKELLHSQDDSTLNKLVFDLICLTDSLALCINSSSIPDKISDYKEALGKVSFDNSKGIFVFTDDIEKVKKYEEELGLANFNIDEVVYIKKNGRTLQLMSACKHMIITTLSDEQWAYFLNGQAKLDLIQIH